MLYISLTMLVSCLYHEDYHIEVDMSILFTCGTMLEALLNHCVPCSTYKHMLTNIIVSYNCIPYTPPGIVILQKFQENAKKQEVLQIIGHFDQVSLYWYVRAPHRLRWYSHVVMPASLQSGLWNIFCPCEENMWTTNHHHDWLHDW